MTYRWAVYCFASTFVDLSRMLCLVFQAHDEIGAEISKSASLERRAGDPARGVEAIEDDPDDGPIVQRPRSAWTSEVESGVKGAMHGAKQKKWVFKSTDF